MKVLLRKYGNHSYVWKNAKWQGEYILTDNDDAVYETQILAVTEDERIGYVQCSHCGELVKNDPESIEAHFAKIEAQKDCMNCDRLAIYGNRTGHKKTYKPNGDGTYSIEETYISRLACTNGYFREDIHSKNLSCKFTACRRKGVREINDTFIKYPGLFDKQLTVDALLAKKYTYHEYNNGSFEYDLRMRGTVFACADDNGIVTHFRVFVRGWAYNFYYSDKYKKLFFYDYGEYNENVTELLSETKMNSIIQKISQLYEEANENE